MSVEDAFATDRINKLRAVGAFIRFVSFEPLLGPITDLNLEDIHWAIVGGESGTQARNMDPYWAVDILAQCRQAGIPFFMKQMGSQWAKGEGLKDSKGGDINDFPPSLRVREYPQ